MVYLTTIPHFTVTGGNEAGVDLVLIQPFLLSYANQFQRAKKVLSDSPGLVDFAIGLVNSVFNLPDRQVMFYEEFE